MAKKPDEYYWRGPGGDSWSLKERGESKRSDDRIQEEILACLRNEPDLEAAAIEIIVDDGEVTLRGNVETLNEKRLAENLAFTVWGVTEVNNQVGVTERKAS